MAKSPYSSKILHKELYVLKTLPRFDLTKNAKSRDFSTQNLLILIDINKVN